MKRAYITPQAESGQFVPELSLLNVSADITDLTYVDDSWDY